MPISRVLSVIGQHDIHDAAAADDQRYAGDDDQQYVEHGARALSARV
jgi:hypothetical protein